MYGWVKLKDGTNEIDHVSCKKPISNDLLNDYVVSGTFTFKNSNSLLQLSSLFVANFFLTLWTYLHF